MLWIYVTILSAFLFAIGQLLDKYIVSWRTSVPTAVVLFLGPVNVIYSVFVFFVFKIQPEVTVVTVIAVLAGILTGIASPIRYNTLSKEEASRVSPLLFTSPLLIAVLAKIFLNEIFPAWIYFGIVLIIGGAFLLSFRWEKGIPKRTPVLGFILAMILLYSVASIIVKWSLMTISLPTFIFYECIGFSAVTFPLWLGPKLRKEFIDSFIKKRSAFMSLIFMEIFGASGAFLLYYAFALGPVSLVSALSSLSPFFVLLLGILLSLMNPTLLKEEISKSIIFTKFIAIVLIVLGVYLII